MAYKTIKMTNRNKENGTLLVASDGDTVGDTVGLEGATVESDIFERKVLGKSADDIEIWIVDTTDCDVDGVVVMVGEVLGKVVDTVVGQMRGVDGLGIAVVAVDSDGSVIPHGYLPNS